MAATSGVAVDVTGVSVGMMVAVASRVAIIAGRAVFVGGNVAVNIGIGGPDVTEVRHPLIKQMNGKIIKYRCHFISLRLTCYLRPKAGATAGGWRR